MNTNRQHTQSAHDVIIPRLHYIYSIKSNTDISLAQLNSHGLSQRLDSAILLQFLKGKRKSSLECMPKAFKKPHNHAPSDWEGLVAQQHTVVAAQDLWMVNLIVFFTDYLLLYYHLLHNSFFVRIQWMPRSDNYTVVFHGAATCWVWSH